MENGEMARVAGCTIDEKRLGRYVDAASDPW